MPDYTLLTLECWATGCDARFAVFTELSNHHLECHELPLPTVRCRQCAHRIPDSPDHLRLQLCSICACLGLLASCVHCGESSPEHGAGGRGCATWLRAATEPPPVEEAAPAPCCRTCGSPVPDSPEPLGSQLCSPCFAAGFLAYCTFCGENHPEHLSPGGRGCATWHQGGAKSPPVEDVEPPCFCGHAESNHTDRTWRLPCCSEGCPCSQFTAVTPSLPALHVFVGRCRAEGLSYSVFDARLLLDTLGVPPDAPAIEWEAGVNEAMQRWRDRMTAPVPPPRLMSNDVARGNPYHYGEHAENGYCATVGCQPIEEASVGEEPAPLPRIMHNPMERWGWRHHGEHAENGYCATAQCLPKKEAP